MNQFDTEFRRRQKARAKVTAIILFALVALFFAIALVRMN
jgi:hypothetical protein